MENYPSYITTPIRHIIGIIILLILRIIVKTSVAFILKKIFGINVKPKILNEDELKKNKKKLKIKNPTNGKQIVHLFMRDIDLVGAAIQKICVYATLAFSISFLIPLLFLIFGFKFNK